ncbi:MAG: hypothetical protein ACI898_001827 [Flavobacteriales bacterium]|jgi:hypothetical protein
MESLKKIAFIGVLTLMGCSVSMQELTLDDVGIVEDPNYDGFEYFRSRQVFSNSLNDTWGMEKDECKDFQAINLGGDNGTALQLEWNKTSCDWVGFGIGWDGYSPKDLSSIAETGAFFFQVKAISERANIPTMIFLLEDYGGVFSAGVVGSHCLERYPIDGEWQEFQLGFDRFDLQECGIDLTNIKQLLVEVQGAGDIVVDNIRIGLKKDRIISAEKKTFPLSNLPLMEATIFESNFSNAWGLGDYEQRSFKVVNDSGNDVLDLKWAKCEECKTYQMGMSWAKWKALDGTDFEGFLEMDVRNNDGNSPSVPLYINLQAYDSSNQTIQLTKEWVEGERYDKQWRKVKIPLAQFMDFMDESKIKQVQFEMKDEGDLSIDNIRITKK